MQWKKLFSIDALLFLGFAAIPFLIWRLLNPTVEITWVNSRSQSIVGIEYIHFDGRWQAPNRLSLGGETSPPSGGGGATTGPRPVPCEVKARWFHFGQQRFYEARLVAPDMPQRAKAILASKPSRGYTLKIIAVVKDNGDLELWLDGSKPPLPFTNDYDFIELLGVAHGQVAPGDVDKYKKATESLRRRKLLPLATTSDKE